MQIGQAYNIDQQKEWPRLHFGFVFVFSSSSPYTMENYDTML